MAGNEVNMPFIRNLASSDRKTRTAALDSLKTFLGAPTTTSRLGPLDFLKLWKGLYYSLWMCDRPIPQQNLCADLADLMTVLPEPAVAPWLCAFWETLGREWTSIDALRLEKFLLLARRVLGASLAWVTSTMPPPPSEAPTTAEAKEAKEMARRHARKVDVLVETLSAWPLDADADLSRVPVGLRLHVLDIWVDEVAKLGLLDAKKTGEAGRQFLDRIGLLVEAQTRSTCKPVRLRAKETLADDRLPWNADEAGDDEVGKTVTGFAEKDSDDKASWDGFDD